MKNVNLKELNAQEMKQIDGGRSPLTWGVEAGVLVLTGLAGVAVFELAYNLNS